MGSRLHNRIGAIQVLSDRYALPAEWLPWNVIDGYSLDEIEHNLREWLEMHGVMLAGNVIVLEDETLFANALDDIRRTWPKIKAQREWDQSMIDLNLELEEIDNDEI